MTSGHTQALDDLKRKHSTDSCQLVAKKLYDSNSEFSLGLSTTGVTVWFSFQCPWKQVLAASLPAVQVTRISSSVAAAASRHLHICRLSFHCTSVSRTRNNLCDIDTIHVFSLQISCLYLQRISCSPHNREYTHNGEERGFLQQSLSCPLSMHLCPTFRTCKAKWRHSPFFLIIIEGKV